MTAFTLTTTLIRVVAFFTLLISIIQMGFSLLLYRGIASIALSESMPGQMLYPIFLAPAAALVISLFLFLLSRPIGSLLTKDLD